MNPSSSSPDPAQELVNEVRLRVAKALAQGLHRLAEAVTERLLGMVNQVGLGRDVQEHHDAWMDWQQHGADWLQGTREAWEHALLQRPSHAVTNVARDSRLLELVDNEEVDNRIFALRMAQHLTERVAVPLETLTQRMQVLLAGAELPAALRPDTLTLRLIEQWAAVGLKRSVLVSVQDALVDEWADVLRQSYVECNEFLTGQGVQAGVDFRARLRRAPSAPMAPETPGHAHHAGPTPAAAGDAGDWSDSDLQFMRSGRAPLAPSQVAGSRLLGQLHRLFSGLSSSSRSASEASPSAQDRARVTPSALDRALAVLPKASAGTGDVSAVLERLAGAMSQGTAELKKATSDETEKATIEIVALMFQSILAEDRIPPVIRVWFARLQVPVLRVALAEPDFLESLDHPARLLIDRMGSCVMGFDPDQITGSELEAEIRRVVQVIEQYPETGRRVFQLVYDEFQKFLAGFLTEDERTARVVSVAQQVEQKETLAIQYTIEMRNLLKDMPVREEIRDFLFKVWAEVLALSAVRHGPQHADTVALKQAATDLVWAASAKPTRAERARVIQSLPGLLRRLRQGLQMVGVVGVDQEVQIKRLSDTLADAFMSRTEAISQAHIDAMAERLARLEDYVSDDGLEELPLDGDSLELLLGVESSGIHILAGDAGGRPTEAMLAQALALQPGLWFSLDHNGSVHEVQYAWRSDRRQLHLFAAVDGASYLFQLRRLAAYLHAGLLVPKESETLTLRATRAALAKIDANPERLLS